MQPSMSGAPRSSSTRRARSHHRERTLKSHRLSRQVLIEHDSPWLACRRQSDRARPRHMLEWKMQPSIIWIVGITFVVLAAGLWISTRPRRPVDLGSVSTSWTTEHNAGDRGGDRSNG
jgi:hypothetical protein